MQHPTATPGLTDAQRLECDRLGARPGIVTQSGAFVYRDIPAGQERWLLDRRGTIIEFDIFRRSRSAELTC